jgi:hypothetical protein
MMPHPVTGETGVDLKTAKHWIRRARDVGKEDRRQSRSRRKSRWLKDCSPICGCNTFRFPIHQPRHQRSSAPAISLAENKAVNGNREW